MFRSTLLAVVIGFGILLSTGCEQAPPTASTPQPGIAVIDLDEVAKQLGRDKQIVTAIRQREAALKNKLVEMAKAYTEQIEKHRKAAPVENQDKKSVQLAQYEQQATKQIKTAQVQAQRDLTRTKGLLVKQFRDAVRPAARQVAQKRGLTVIVTKQDSLLYDFAPESDITNEVVEVLRSQQTPAKAE